MKTLPIEIYVNWATESGECRDKEADWLEANKDVDDVGEACVRVGIYRLMEYGEIVVRSQSIGKRTPVASKKKCR